MIKLRPLERNTGGAQVTKARNPSWGYALPATGDQVYRVSHAKFRKANLHLVLNPKAFRTNMPTKNVIDVLKEKMVLRVWATPRHSSFTSNVITYRTWKDLPTQVKFEVNTPNHLRRGIINPEFLEWLMGYPKNWTKFERDETNSN
jgi:hypothetical protein